jgi:hypothetical protein
MPTMHVLSTPNTTPMQKMPYEFTFHSMWVNQGEELPEFVDKPSTDSSKREAFSGTPQVHVLTL